MDNEIFDVKNETYNSNKGERIVTTILLVLDLLVIFFSFIVYNKPPSLGYLIIVYIAGYKFLAALIMTAIALKKRRLITGLITIGTSISIALAGTINSSNEVTVITGQIVTGLSFLLTVFLIVYIWKK